MGTNNIENYDSISWENKIFVFGFIKDATEPYYEFAEKLSKPAAYFRNDELYEKYKKLNALGNYWLIVSSIIEKGVDQRKIFIANVPFSVIEDKKFSHKITLAESRLILLPGCKYIHFTKGDHEIYVPRELELTYEASLPTEFI